MNKIIAWLLDSDPSIRWQVQRDLLGARSSVYKSEQAKVSRTGWGADLLARQDPDGNWGGGIYSPKWISTTYTLLLLRRLGLPGDNGQAQQACANFLLRGLERDGGINLFGSIKYSETCVNGMLLALLSYFRSPDPRVSSVVKYLLKDQMRDGSWNCRRVLGATHGSFHTTISVLEGLAEYSAGRKRVSNELRRAVAAGQEFLLRHRLYKSHQTGRIVDPEMTRMHFPPRWHYDVIRALDYFRSVDASHDPRLEDPTSLLQRKRSPAGTWVLNRPWSGRVFFNMEETGRPSRWNTLRALRILNWWEA